MEKLVLIIEELRSRFRDHHDILSLNETRTRLSLIDPLCVPLAGKCLIHAWSHLNITITPILSGQISTSEG